MEGLQGKGKGIERGAIRGRVWEFWPFCAHWGWVGREGRVFMYLPKHNEVLDLGVMHGLMRAHPLGAWVTLGEGGLVANHIPFLVDASRGERGTLVGHVARANPVWRLFSAAVPSVVIFQGAQGYVTPSWYPAKAAHGKVVPTWNYSVVHAHGVARVIEEKGWLLRHVTELVDTHEAGEALPWKVSDAPGEFVDGMLGAIVGIEIPIDRLVGKVSQNRSEADRRGVVEGLIARGDECSKEMARLVEEFGSERPAVDL